MKPSTRRSREAKPRGLARTKKRLKRLASRPWRCAPRWRRPRCDIAGMSQAVAPTYPAVHPRATNSRAALAPSRPDIAANAPARSASNVTNDVVARCVAASSGTSRHSGPATCVGSPTPRQSSRVDLASSPDTKTCDKQKNNVNPIARTEIKIHSRFARRAPSRRESRSRSRPSAGRGRRGARGGSSRRAWASSGRRRPPRCPHTN